MKVSTGAVLPPSGAGAGEPASETVLSQGAGCGQGPPFLPVMFSL